MINILYCFLHMNVKIAGINGIILRNKSKSRLEESRRRFRIPKKVKKARIIEQFIAELQECMKEREHFKITNIEIEGLSELKVVFRYNLDVKKYFIPASKVLDEFLSKTIFRKFACALKYTNFRSLKFNNRFIEYGILVSHRTHGTREEVVSFSTTYLKMVYSCKELKSWDYSKDPFSYFYLLPEQHRQDSLLFSLSLNKDSIFQAVDFEGRPFPKSFWIPTLEQLKSTADYFLEDEEVFELPPETCEGWLKFLMERVFHKFWDANRKSWGAMSKVFKINEFMTLRLEDALTNIYVKDRLFTHCKYLLFEIPTKNVEDYSSFDSIDEVQEYYDRSHEPGHIHPTSIPAEAEFWGHCSNLQAWYEYGYDTRILHSNLAFPLLRKLMKAGDPQAKRAFKEEVARRMEANYLPVSLFILEEDYLKYFSKQELITLAQNIKDPDIKEILLNYRNRFYDRLKKMDQIRFKHKIAHIVGDIAIRDEGTLVNDPPDGARLHVGGNWDISEEEFKVIDAETGEDLTDKGDGAWYVDHSEDNDNVFNKIEGDED